jgi:hypothetical protein
MLVFGKITKFVMTKIVNNLRSLKEKNKNMKSTVLRSNDFYECMNV